MKYLKLTLLIILISVFSKSIAKEGVYVHYYNFTTGDSIYPYSGTSSSTYPMLLPANIGDSVLVYVYAFDQGPVANNYWYILSDTATVVNFQPSDTIAGSHYQSSITMIVTEYFYLLAANSYQNQYFHFVSPTGIDDNIAEASINVYPTPVDGQLFIEGYFNKPSDVVISIYDISGKVFSVDNESVNQGQFTFTKNIENLKEGLYFVSYSTPTYRTSKKFIKK